MLEYYDIGIRVEHEEKKYKEINFSSKKEYKQLDFIQNTLKKYHSKQKETFEKISCLCTPLDEPRCLLSIKHITKSDKYILSNFPNNPPHKIYCPFYQDNEGRALVDDNGNYSNEIFQEERDLYSKEKDLRERKIISEREEQRKHTYNNFCRDLISETIVYSFNIANRSKEYSDVVNPSKRDFIIAFYKLLFKEEEGFIKQKSVIDSIPENHSFDFGIIDELPSLDNNKKSYFIKAKKYISKDKTINTSYLISPQKFKRVLKSITNYTNLISGPYFYIGVINNYKYNGKWYNKVVRYNIYPVSYSDKGIIFIESNLERKYASSLLAQGVSFIKPFLGNEPYKIKKGVFSYLDSNNNYRVFRLKGYRPDFIEFRKDRHIVEVAGYSDETYQKELTRKVEYFESEAKKHNYKYRIDLVDF
jgi:hypothetical protein